MTAALFSSPVAFVDVETTGGQPGGNRIIDIGIVAATGGKLEFEWSSLINPGRAIPPSIQHYTGISDEMVRAAPFFEDIVDEIAARLDGRLFVAHNARFDYGFVRAEFRRLARKFSSRVACTVRLSRRLHPEMPAHNLDAVIEHHGLKVATRHRALPDAQVLWRYWNVLQAQRAIDELDEVLREITSLKSLPAHLPSSLPDELPETPGVYRFYGEGDALLYIGKANNIRQRVLSHWQGAARDSRARRLTELTRRVDWIETAGELGALLTEARLVRECKPLYNRQLRGSRQVFTWVVADDGAAPRLSPLDQLPLSFESSAAFGLYRNEAEARRALTALARDESLCLKVLGLERAKGSCFAYQLKHCKGACVGAEPLRQHAVRLKISMASQRVRSWDFPGPIGLREVGENGREQLHIVDEWRHVATLEAGAAWPSGRRKPFDLDVYRILARRLNGASPLDIVTLPAEPDLDADQDVA